MLIAPTTVGIVAVLTSRFLILAIALTRPSLSLVALLGRIISFNRLTSVLTVSLSCSTSLVKPSILVSSCWGV